MERLMTAATASSGLNMAPATEYFCLLDDSVDNISAFLFKIFVTRKPKPVSTIHTYTNGNIFLRAAASGAPV
jgi:hypothetical protein